MGHTGELCDFQWGTVMHISCKTHLWVNKRPLETSAKEFLVMSFMDWVSMDAYLHRALHATPLILEMNWNALSPDFTNVLVTERKQIPTVTF